MNRRQALSVLATLPFAARVSAQTRATAKHRVALSAAFGLLIEPDGSLHTWNRDPGSAREAYDAHDVLGLGHNRPVDGYTLFRVPELTSVVAAAAGTGAYAVLRDGQLLSWGSGGYGLLGSTPQAEFETKGQPRVRSNSPQPVAVTFNAVDVSAKGEHVLALARDGSVYAWGRGDAGQLGIGDMPMVNYRSRSARVENFVPYPVRIDGLTDVIAISAGNMHSMALLRDGTVRVWGQNKSGQLGDGSTVDRNTPTPVEGVRNVISIAATGYSCVAVLSDGTVMEWGGSVPPRRPALLAGARGIRSVAGGGHHVVAITQTGAVMTWGEAAHYETGRGPNAHLPGLVKGLTDVQSITASPHGSAAVLGSGRIMTWSQVRPWHRPDGGSGSTLSPYPILLWVDGLEQP
jgi:hypothetical protein